MGGLARGEFGGAGGNLQKGWWGGFAIRGGTEGISK